MIQLENLTFHYPNVIEAALRSINLTINTSETVAVLGANGSGKSTFAKIITKILKPDRGLLKIGIDNSSSVGLVFQNPENQMVALTVEKELAFGLENESCPLDEMKQKVDEILERFKIAHLRHRIISELSGGEKQRIAVASVMITEPDLLILDEPDSFLDFHGKEMLMEQIKIIKRNNPLIIIIHITQYLEIAKLYPRILLFENGKIVTDRNPVEIIAYYKSISKSKADKNLNYESLLPDKITEPKVLHVENLFFQFIENQKLLHNISLTLSQGEVIGLVGKSGSGKSTLASLLAGLISLNLGNIEILPQSVINNDTSAITMLFQQPENQFFLQTVAEEINFGLKNRKISSSKQQIFDLLTLVGLDYKKIAYRDPQSLSGGEKRRLAFAVVIALSFDFIIFDEPTCGLDLQGVSMFEDLIENLKNLNKGIIVASHDFEMLKTVSDKILYLHATGSAEILTHAEFFDGQPYSQVLGNAKLF